ncbi:MAG: histidine kinase [Pirellulaceae bacterium]|nr:MAG: histidine kinase [Pirellulaceae bacterium]
MTVGQHQYRAGGWKTVRRRPLALLGGAALGLITWVAPNVGVGQERLTSQWAMTNTHVRLDSTSGRQMVQMVVNTSREITATRPFKQVRIHNPNVVSAQPLEGGNRLQINARSTGVTQLDLVAADGSTHTVEVLVLGDVRELEAILRREFPDANLSLVPVQQGCIISGYMVSDEHVQAVISIAELFFPPENIINRLTVTGVHTIQLETQIMEISRTKLRRLGIDWSLNAPTFLSSDGGVTSSIGGLVAAAGGQFTTNSEQNFLVGIVDDSDRFFLAIEALRKNNLIKVLANPTLVAMDGRVAKFNSGGDFPVPVPAGLGQIGIDYREYGTQIEFVAKVRDGGRIWLEVRPEVSEIDPTRLVQVEGLLVPGTRKRYVDTSVEMTAGQTLAIAGLLQVRTEAYTRGIPFLADMPYVGNFFRRNYEEQNEIELLITVTPHFAGAMDPCQVPATAPGLNSDSPSDQEFYGRGHIEVPMVPDGSCPDCGPSGGLILEVPGQEPTPAGGTLLPPASPEPLPLEDGRAAGEVSMGLQPPRLVQEPPAATPGGGAVRTAIGSSRELR